MWQVNVSYSEISRESQVTDATRHESDVEAEITLSSETAKRMTEKQYFESTSRTTIAHSAGVSIGATIKVGYTLLIPFCLLVSTSQ